MVNTCPFMTTTMAKLIFTSACNMITSLCFFNYNFAFITLCKFYRILDKLNLF